MLALVLLGIISVVSGQTIVPKEQCNTVGTTPGDRRTNKDSLSIVSWNAEFLFRGDGTGTDHRPPHLARSL